MAENFINRRQELRGTAAAWTSNNTILLDGEWGVETDTGQVKIGDGVTAWNDLPYFGDSQNLQQVTDEGATTTNNITTQGYTSTGTRAGEDLVVTNGDYDNSGTGFKTILDTDDASFTVLDNAASIRFSSEGISLKEIGGFESLLLVPTALTSGRTYDFPDASGTIALTSDIPSATETATYSATNTGTVTLDCDTFDSTYRILTGNTDIQWSNTPASGETFVKTLEVIGAFSLTFTTSTKVIGTYVDDGTTVNIITVSFANYPTVGLRTTVMINQ